MAKVVLAFVGTEGAEQGSDAPPRSFDGVLVSFAGQGSELGEDEEDQKTVSQTVFPTQVDWV